jgi:hypothetical protein
MAIQKIQTQSPRCCIKFCISSADYYSVKVVPVHGMKSYRVVEVWVLILYHGIMSLWGRLVYPGESDSDTQ